MLTNIANGEGPTWLRNARLIAIAKQGGGVRPIAIGEVLCRLTATSLNKMFLEQAESLPNNQLCLLKDGVLLGSYVIARSIEENNHVAALDMSNAFNLLTRVSLLSSVKGTIVEGYVRWAYSKHSDLLLTGDIRIKLQSGVQQGDPLGMTLFSIAISTTLKQIQERHLDVKIISYADNIIFVGNPRDIEHAAAEIREKLCICGVKLNQQKSIIWPRLTEAQNNTFELISKFQQSKTVVTILGVAVSGDISSALTDAVSEAGINFVIETTKPQTGRNGNS